MTVNILQQIKAITTSFWTKTLRIIQKNNKLNPPKKIEK